MGQTKNMLIEEQETAGGISMELEAFTPKEQGNLNLFLLPKEETSLIPLENKTILHADRGELSEMASMMIEAVDDGFADPLDTLIIAKKGMYVFENIVKGMKGKAYIDGGKLSKHNVDIRTQDVGVKYHFDGCGDMVWNELNQQIAELTAKQKEREAFLKSLKGETKYHLDEETGEEQTFETPIYPPARVGASSLVLTIK